MLVRNTGFLLLWLFVGTLTCFAQKSDANSKLQQALKQYPDADTNSDGVLTMQEARAYLLKINTASDDSATKRIRPIFETEIFKATAEELDRAMQADNASKQKEALQFPKGNGLRIISTGHSWVAPALRTLPQIAVAAGLHGQHIRSHTSGGGTGSANSIWRKEFGKYGSEAAKPILLPAIATGQWDVMTWGAFYGDVPEHYTQWVDVCLKANPKMTFFIQDGWPTFDKSMSELEPAVALQQIDESHRDLQRVMFQQEYEILSKRYPGKIHIAPAGAAVVEMLHHYFAGKLTGFDCVSENLGGTKGIYRDGGHLSKESGMEWLVGYLYYGMLYQRSPQLIEGFLPPGVSKEVDPLLRVAAWNAIKTSPYSGIRDENADGIGDEPIQIETAKQ